MVAEPEGTAIPVLDLPPEADSEPRKPIFVGEVQLADFRKLLQKQGFRTYLRDGVLTVNDSLAVRKNNVGQVVLEGSLTEDFYLVRDLLYDQFVVL